MPFSMRLVLVEIRRSHTCKPLVIRLVLMHSSKLKSPDFLMNFWAMMRNSFSKVLNRARNK